MKAWHGVALLIVGLAAGFGLGSWTASKRATSDKLELLETGLKELKAERAKLDRAEADRTAVREVRRRPRDPATEPPGAIPGGSRSPNDAVAPTTTDPAVLADERIAAARSQLKLARLDLQQAMTNHDGEGALRVLKHLAAIAKDVPEARDEAMKLALDINKDVEGVGELRLPMQSFYGGLGDPAIRDLMTWSLENQASSTADFRVLSAWSLPWTLPTDDTIARFDAALGRESERSVQEAMVDNLGSMNSAKAEAVLVRVLGESARDESVRAAAATGLATSPDAAIQRALDAAAAADPDPRIQTAQRISLVVRDPPASGVLVLTTTNDGAAVAAGVKPGDVIVSYNGRPVPTEPDLRREAQGAAGVESVAVVVVRDGHETTLQAKPGRLGITLKPVQKK